MGEGVRSAGGALLTKMRRKRREHQRKLRKRLKRYRRQRGEMIREDHHCGNRRIKRHRLHIIRHLLNRLMHEAHRLLAHDHVLRILLTARPRGGETIREVVDLLLEAEDAQYLLRLRH